MVNAMGNGGVVEFGGPQYVTVTTRDGRAILDAPDVHILRIELCGNVAGRNMYRIATHDGADRLMDTLVCTTDVNVLVSEPD